MGVFNREASICEKRINFLMAKNWKSSAKRVCFLIEPDIYKIRWRLGDSVAARAANIENLNFKNKI